MAQTPPLKPMEPSAAITAALALTQEQLRKAEDEVAKESRLTREQTTRAALEVDEIDEDWRPAPYTTSPPAREGMEQRWVRCRITNVDDIQNIFKRRTRGWEPRSASTVPKGFIVMLTKFGDFGDVISNQDSILMERPIAEGQKYRRSTENYTRKLYESIRENIEDRMPRKRGTRGGNIDEFDVKYSRGGRRPMIDD